MHEKEIRRTNNARACEWPWSLDLSLGSRVGGGGRSKDVNYTFGVKRAAKATQLHSWVTLRDVDLERDLEKAFTMGIT
jgi:hypothetical protein